MGEDSMPDGKKRSPSNRPFSQRAAAAASDRGRSVSSALHFPRGECSPGLVQLLPPHHTLHSAHNRGCRPYRLTLPPPSQHHKRVNQSLFPLLRPLLPQPP